jgi:hypothetical protein
VLEIGLHLVLVPGVGVDHEPLEHALQLLEENAVDEGADDLVEAPEIRTDDRARENNDDHALERLPTGRPIGLLELGNRLADELPALALGFPAGLLLDRLLGGPNLSRASAARSRCSITGGSPRRPPLSPRLAGQLPGLPVRRMAAAPAAVLLELDPIRGVPLRFLGLVVATLALRAGERDRDSDSGCHCSFRLVGGTREGRVFE